MSGAPVPSVVQGAGWVGHAFAVVAVVVTTGLLLRRAPGVAVLAAQLLAVLGLLTFLFTTHGVLGVLPGPAAFAELGDLLAGAAAQIDIGTAPIPATPEILLLLTAAFGLLAVAVYAIAVSAGAPAAAGLPLLAVFAVPAALAGHLLPWWAVAAAAAGYGLLLVGRGGAGRQLPAGLAVTAAAVAVALLLGSAATMVGTGGRVAGGSGGGGAGGAIGLNPFTALRGQLTQTGETELFRVSGLPRPQYLRALTLRDFVPSTGWQAGSPEPGVPLTGALPNDPTPPGDQAVVDVENVGFRDYWLPLYGVPQTVTGVTPDTWAFDVRSGTAHSSRPRREDSWRERALLPAPTAEELRAASGPARIDPAYLATTGVDPRVAALAADVTRDSRTDFDRAMALVDFFTGPRSPFHYSLRTAPGNGDDALVEFLTVGRTGYCEQFASAMAVMLRTVGVPARVAVGFTAGSDLGDHRLVTTADAHAWVEAYFPGYGWTAFDPTPLTDGRALVPPYVQQARDQAAGAGQQVVPDQTVPDQLPDTRTGAAQEPAAPAAAPAPGANRAQDSGFGPVLPLVLVAVVLLGLAPAGLRALIRRRRLAAVAEGGREAARAAWAELLAESADRGVPSPPSDTVRGAARRLVREHGLDADAQQALRQVVAAVEASWYGGRHPGAGELTAAVRQVRAAIAAGRRRTLRERLMPRSLLGRGRRDEAATPAG
nr:transglutaminaseTgpA domain-containing protein [Pseudonocardia acidicola]